MTPLKAIEAIQAVKFVASTRYPRNQVCAHPECDRTDTTGHHIFGRGKGENRDSWFVLLPLNGPEGTVFEGDQTDTLHPSFMSKKAIPHVVGLCGHGTEGHHGDVEAHRAWIRYEDGVFNWYDRVPHDKILLGESGWEPRGPLDPQPFAWGDKKKKPVRRLKGAERAERKRISLAIPEGFAGGGAVWDEMFGTGKNGQELGWVRVALGALREEPIDQEHGLRVDHRPPFFLIADMAHNWRELFGYEDAGPDE